MVGKIDYYAIQCKNCGLWRGCMIKNLEKYVFKCHKCRKGTKVLQYSKLGVTVKINGPYIAYDIPIAVKELNGRSTHKKRR